MAEKRQALPVCLLIAIVLVGTYFVILDKSQFFRYSSASLYFTFQNQTNRTLDFQFLLYLGSDGTFNFNGSETSKLHGNFSVSESPDGSEVEVGCNDLAPSDHLSFVTQEINVTPMLHGIEDTEMTLSFSIGNLNFSKQEFGYDGVISLLDSQGVSVASRDYYLVALSQRHDDRTSFYYLNALIAVMTMFFVGIVAMIVWHRARWFPIITLSIVFLTLFLYVFVGSASEIQARNWWWLFPLSVFIHGYDWHIYGNLVFFAILSVPFESFLKMKTQSMKHDILVWYFVPLILPTFSHLTPWGGFGLSLSIEIMTWTLWVYIIINYKELITNKTRTFLAVLSGVPSYIFVSWVVPFLFGSYNNPFDCTEALIHIVFGIVSGVGVLLFAYLRRDKTEIGVGDFQI